MGEDVGYFQIEIVQSEFLCQTRLIVKIYKWQKSLGKGYLKKVTNNVYSLCVSICEISYQEKFMKMNLAGVIG